jgi:fructose-1-phosphate kinase PfkB-like protein
MPPAVLTLTANLLAETTFLLPSSPVLGSTQRAVSSSFQVGGKGLNVAKMLARLGTPALALAAAGGPVGEACRIWAAAQPWRIELLPTTTPTRAGLVVRGPDPATAPETTFLGPDAPLCADAFAALAAQLDAAAPETIVALCGSVPGWASPAAASLRAALTRRARTGRLVVDTYGPALAELTTLPAELIKINADEFAALVGSSPHPAERALALETLASRSPVKVWIVSDGPHSVHLAHTGAPVITLNPPIVPEVSATGSGDVLLAALLHARLDLNCDWREALAYALPLASANAAHPRVAEFDLTSMELADPHSSPKLNS